MTTPRPIDPDRVSRTALLAVFNNSAVSVEAALDMQARTGVVICADVQVCSDYSGQAALLTAVRTAARAFGIVWVVLPDCDPAVLGGPHRGEPLRNVLFREGVRLHEDSETIQLVDPRPVILIGSDVPSPDVSPPTKVQLRVTWSEWTAVVTPTSRGAEPCDRDCVLAAIAAGALAVNEAFGAVEARPGSDRGHRIVHLDLYAPLAEGGRPPAITWAPNAWWLVGLGHLGQAFSWAISWLPYLTPSEVEVALQDTQTTTESNHSTGILTVKGSDGEHKTRMVAAKLEGAGLSTRLHERRLGKDLRREPTESHVALLGIDNLAARRLISDVGWKLALDVGLGRGPDGYASMHLVRFPGGRTSDQIPAWQDGADPAVPDAALLNSPALRALHERDACGAVTLAGTAAGASFVGVVAGCLAVAEACRELNGGAPSEVIDLDLRCHFLRGGLATVGPLPAHAELRVG